jgi:hypothetical protein
VKGSEERRREMSWGVKVGEVGLKTVRPWRGKRSVGVRGAE